MNILAYGEDALTLWALKNKLNVILQKLHDESAPSQCHVIYRPSFGRGRKPSFGEFDFLILSGKSLYLGESKWSESSGSKKTRAGKLKLNKAQQDRHKIFRFYVEQWFKYSDSTSDWNTFVEKITPEAAEKGIGELACGKHRLSKNLQEILGFIKDHFKTCPIITNVLLYLQHEESSGQLKPPDGFELPVVSYSDGVFKESNFIELEL